MRNPFCARVHKSKKSKSEDFRVIESIQGSIGEVEETIHSQVSFPKMRLKRNVLIRSDHPTYIDRSCP